MNYTNTSGTENRTLAIKTQLSQSMDDIQRNELIKGLSAKKKYIPSKYFYDKKGSELFEQITKSDEYYPTRTELQILESNAKIITNDLSDTNIIELGSGDCSKISVLFKSFNGKQFRNSCYFPIDISISAIEKSISLLRIKFPTLTITGISADFMQNSKFIPDVKNKLICFFGSTIGNLKPDEAFNFIKNIGNSMNPGDTFLLGVDMVKDIKVLEEAYNDKLNITAEFNKNILINVNRILKTRVKIVFFEHYAFFNTQKQRIEMHLKALEEIKIKSPYLSREIIIKKGEYIHTENSYKFTPKKIYEFAEVAGLSVKNIFTDKNQFFSLAEFIK